MRAVFVATVTLTYFFCVGCKPELKPASAIPEWQGGGASGTRRVEVDISNTTAECAATMPSLFCGNPDAGPFKVTVQAKTNPTTTVATVTVDAPGLEASSSRSVFADFASASNASNNYLQDVKELSVEVDSTHAVAEVDELNNVHSYCAQPQVPVRECWLQGRCYLSPQDIGLVARSVNTKGSDAHYPLRLSGIATAFHDDWPNHVGIIGMQEVRASMDRCPVGSGNINGAACFARVLASQFGEAATEVHYSAAPNLGIVVGGEWQIISSTSWKLGTDRDKYGPNPSERSLLEALVQHKTQPWRFRFYSTHLSHHADQIEQRQSQIDKLRQLIKGRPRDKELPPIVVGDFNFIPVEEPSSYDKMNADFHLVNEAALGCDDRGRPIQAGIDQIWVGRYTSFLRDRDFEPVRYHTVLSTWGNGLDLTTPRVVGDYNGRLTDHNSPGFSFRIEAR
jgi:endonuclease/exonuclease/phosphatase family metal-dependent hydrolase